ncbi:zinc ribbon domain-containing protein [Acinetobacter radioresistens]|uniref:zinc ribbon domain-containing protein n=1 Tax=Acinetobacter radioresistens TaxID=40216 RepID=UPI0021CDB8B3|nr:zinc ribbon domain-containing protein [Acinetobacter radioresistens]MCU4517791.1 zinc ribbon domain-containing protein [Acinetobacter radioresistens]
MALIKCKECGHQISKNAETCPNCGAKNKKNVPTWLAVLVLIVVGIAMIQCINQNHNKRLATESAAEDSPTVPNSNWIYKEETDEMRGSKKYSAYAVSSNKVDFEFPHQGGASMAINLRKDKTGTDVMLIMDKGQFFCGIQGCEVAFKFDDGPVQSITMIDPDNLNTKVLFVMHDRTEDKIISQLKNSKTLMIEAPFFQDGKRQFKFDVTGLNWAH